MKELQHRQKVKQRMYSTPALVVLFVLTLLLIRGAYAVIIKARSSVTETADLQARVLTLSEKEFDLKQKIERLKTDEGIDEEIKERYNVSAEGEHVAVIIDPQGAATTSATSSLPWYQKALHAIIDAL